MSETVHERSIGLPALLLIMSAARAPNLAYSTHMRDDVGRRLGVEINESTLYSTLQYLTTNGYLTKERRETFNGRMRAYYAPTRKGEHIIGVFRDMLK